MIVWYEGGFYSPTFEDGTFKGWFETEEDASSYLIKHGYAREEDAYNNGHDIVKIEYYHMKVYSEGNSEI